MSRTSRHHEHYGQQGQQGLFDFGNIGNLSFGNIVNFGNIVIEQNIALQIGVAVGDNASVTNLLGSQTNLSSIFSVDHLIAPQALSRLEAVTGISTWQ